MVENVYRFGEGQTRDGLFKVAQADDVQRVQADRVPDAHVRLQTNRPRHYRVFTEFYRVPHQRKVAL